MKSTLQFILLLAFCILASQPVQAQIPRTISYQGVLTDADGNALDGHFTLTFKLYSSAEGDSPIWQEIQSVEATDGLFNVILGESNPLDLPFDVPYWLGITVGDGAELQPRIPLTSVAYSLSAGSVADSSVTTAKIRDGAVTQAKLAPDVSLPPGGRAGGDLTGTYPNPSLAPNVVTTAKIADKAVTAAKIADGQVVKSINNLKDDVTLAAGGNVTITPSGDTLTISASGGAGDGHSLDASDGDPVDAVYVNAAGNVGIGTSNPAARLHVAGITRFDLAGGRIDMSTPGGWPGMIAYAENSHRREIIFDDDGLRLLASSSSGPSPALNGIIIDEDGKVGIGQAPEEKPWPWKLQVRSHGAYGFRVGNANSWFQVVTGGNTRLGFGNGHGKEGGYISVQKNADNDHNIMVLSACNDRGDCSGSLALDENSNVGIGTWTPEAKLHVARGDIVLGDDKIQNTTGRSIYLAGHVFLTPWGTGDVAYLQARRGDTSGDTELQFRTTWEGHVNEAMRITSLGDVGIGTTAPKATLHVKGRQLWIDGANGASPFVVWAEDGHEKWYITTTGIHSDFEINKIGGGAALRLASTTGNLGVGKTSPQYKLDVAGSVAGQGPYINLSDRRFKKNIRTLSHALDKVMQLRGVNFEWRRDEYPDMNLDKGRQIGFIAQEIEQVLPEVVTKSNEGEYSVAYGQVVPVLVEAIKEQQKIIQELKDKIQQMESIVKNSQAPSVQARSN